MDEGAGRGPTRSAGARVVLVDGFLAGYLRRGERDLLLFLPDAEPRRSQATREVARVLRRLALGREEGRRGMLLAEIDGGDATAHSAAAVFVEEGFVRTGMGLQLRPGIAIAGSRDGGGSMAEQPRTNENVESPAPDETRDTERERVRSSNDRDQAQERAGEAAPHNRGYDEAVRGGVEEGVEPLEEDVDPDSAAADVDRDDTSID